MTFGPVDRKELAWLESIKSHVSHLQIWGHSYVYLIISRLDLLDSEGQVTPL